MAGAGPEFGGRGLGKALLLLVKVKDQEEAEIIDAVLAKSVTACTTGPVLCCIVLCRLILKVLKSANTALIFIVVQLK